MVLSIHKSGLQMTRKRSVRKRKSISHAHINTTSGLTPTPTSSLATINEHDGSHLILNTQGFFPRSNIDAALYILLQGRKPEASLVQLSMNRQIAMTDVQTVAKWNRRLCSEEQHRSKNAIYTKQNTEAEHREQAPLL